MQLPDLSTPLESIQVIRHPFLRLFVIESHICLTESVETLQGHQDIVAPQAWGQGEDWVTHRRFRKQAKKQLQKQPPSQNPKQYMVDQVHLLRKHQPGRQLGKGKLARNHNSTAAKVYPGFDDSFEKMLAFGGFDEEKSTVVTSFRLMSEPDFGNEASELPADMRDLQDTQKEIVQLQQNMKSIPEGTLRNAILDTVVTLEEKADRLQVSRQCAQSAAHFNAPFCCRTLCGNVKSMRLACGTKYRWKRNEDTRPSRKLWKA